MSTTVTAPQPASADANQDEYRALHTGSLLGLLVAIVSLVFPIAATSFTDMSSAASLIIIPAAGLVISLWALRAVRASPELYTGATPALVGVLLAAFSLLGGTAYGGYVYATEVPDGYTRTSFLEMKPDKFEEAGRVIVPSEIESLLGKKVFIKGYIREDSTNRGLRKGITEFLLVRDNNECCFGDLSDVKFYDQVAVELGPGLSADYSLRVFRLGGILGFRIGNRAEGEPAIVYTLEADYCK